MNKDLIMESDILDILFEKKNKMYGAYTLRKFYNKRMRIAVALMLMCITLISALTFIPFKDVTTTSWVIVPDVATGKIFEEPKQKKVILQDHVQTMAKTTHEKFNSAIKIVDSKDPSDKLPEDLSNATIDNHTAAGSGSDIGKVNMPDDSTAGKVSKVITEDVVDINTPLEEADTPPTFPGGMEALRKFLKNNLVNPGELEAGEEVTVKVKFVVGHDGKLKEFIFLQKGGNEFDNEVIRVLKKMPQWVPGNLKGKNVSVYRTIPIKFVGFE